MKKMVAYCGIVCSNCPTFIATQKNDDEERRKVAEFWSKKYGAEIKPEEINCDGCRTRGPRIFSYCKVCEIRKCAQEKNSENCAYCEEYACEKLSKFFSEKISGTDAKKLLDKIRASRPQK